MCLQSFHMVNIDEPDGVDAPPLNTQLLCGMRLDGHMEVCNFRSLQKNGTIDCNDWTGDLEQSWWHASVYEVVS